MLTQKCKYALRALIVLARESDQDVLLIGEIAERAHLPKKFLEAILLELNRRGIVRSRRGRAGGYALAKPADLITFGQVIRLMDGPLAPTPCTSVNFYQRCADCPDEAQCEIRRVMRRVREAIASTLDRTTLKDAIDEERGEPGQLVPGHSAVERAGLAAAD